MIVPDAIAAQLAALNSAIAGAGGLDSASFATRNALALQAASLAEAAAAAIPGAAGALDTWAAPLMPQDIASGVAGLLAAAQAQSALADLEGFVARIEINLENG